MAPKSAAALQLQHVSVRMATFTEGVRVGGAKLLTYWPHDTPAPEDMAECGFYYTPTRTQGDQVTCFWCGKKERALGGEQHVASVHYAHSRKCPYAVIHHFLAQYRGAQDIAGYWRRLTHDNELPVAVLEPHSKPSVQLRLATFKGLWKFDSRRRTKVSARAMAAAGFFFSPTHPGDDRVICMYCGCPLLDWGPGDDPRQEHELNARAYRRENALPPCHFLATLEEPLDGEPAADSVFELQHIPSSPGVLRATRSLQNPPAAAPSPTAAQAPRTPGALSSPLNKPRDSLVGAVLSPALSKSSPSNAPATTELDGFDISIDQLSDHEMHLDHARPLRRYPRRKKQAVFGSKPFPATPKERASTSLILEVTEAPRQATAGSAKDSRGSPDRNSNASLLQSHDSLVLVEPSSITVPQDTEDGDYYESVHEASSPQKHHEKTQQQTEKMVRSQFSDDGFGLNEKDIADILNSPKKHRKMRVVKRKQSLSPPPAVYDISGQNLGDYDEHNLSFLERDLKRDHRGNARDTKVAPRPAPVSHMTSSFKNSVLLPHQYQEKRGVLDSSVMEIPKPEPADPLELISVGSREEVTLTGSPNEAISAENPEKAITAKSPEETIENKRHALAIGKQNGEGHLDRFRSVSNLTVHLDGDNNEGDEIILDPKSPNTTGLKILPPLETLPVAESTANDIDLNLGLIRNSLHDEDDLLQHKFSLHLKPDLDHLSSSAINEDTAKEDALQATSQIAAPVKVNGLGKAEVTLKIESNSEELNTGNGLPETSRERKVSQLSAVNQKVESEQLGNKPEPIQNNKRKGELTEDARDSKRVKNEDPNTSQNRSGDALQIREKDLEQRIQASGLQQEHRLDLENISPNQTIERQESPQKEIIIPPSSYKAYRTAFEEMQEEFENSSEEIDRDENVKVKTSSDSRTRADLSPRNSISKELIESKFDLLENILTLPKQDLADSKAPNTTFAKASISFIEDSVSEALPLSPKPALPLKNDPMLGENKEDELKNLDQNVGIRELSYRDAKDNSRVEDDDLGNDTREPGLETNAEEGTTAATKDSGIKQIRGVSGEQKLLKISPSNLSEAPLEEQARVSRAGPAEHTESPRNRALVIEADANVLSESHDFGNHPSFLEIQSSTPHKMQQKEPSSTRQALSTVSMGSALAEIKELDDAIDYISGLAMQGHELHNDVDGALTNFISAMPEEEEEMQIEEWIRHNAASCKKIVEELGEAIVRNYEAEFDKVIEFVANLETID